jgi:hypothetical protein
VDGVSWNCREGKHRACTGCPACACHAVPPTADYWAAREALARKRAERKDGDGEATA